MHEIAITADIRRVESIQFNHRVNDIPPFNQFLPAPRFPVSFVSSAFEMSDPIAEYFAQFPSFKFQYSSNSDWRQIDAFNALAGIKGWSQDRRRLEWVNFQNAWTHVGETEFGQSRLEHYQEICRDLGIDPVPDSINRCKEQMKKVYVNIVDLIQYRKNKRECKSQGPLTMFDNLEELKSYTEREKKHYPSENAKAELLRELLKIFE